MDLTTFRAIQAAMRGRCGKAKKMIDTQKELLNRQDRREK